MRRATDQDAPAICSIYNFYIRNTVISFEELEIDANEVLSRMKRETDPPWWVAESDGSVVAFAYGTAWKTRTAYAKTLETTIYVDSTRRGKGVGFTLYKHLVEQLRMLGYHVLLGGIAQPNEASVRLHERLGFKPVGMLKEVGYKHDRWVDVGYWELILDRADH
ncbi:MAG: N-acetyltransferase [Bacteroidia bacterium]|nr:N-acetyltransferase [Bacteroidia bacterium]